MYLPGGANGLYAIDIGDPLNPGSTYTEDTSVSGFAYDVFAH